MHKQGIEQYFGSVSGYFANKGMKQMFRATEDFQVAGLLGFTKHLCFYEGLIGLLFHQSHTETDPNK